MKEKILTVSVAAYNVEKYLKKLVGSITAMKNRDMVEVLIVDDGSKDRTPDLGMKSIAYIGCMGETVTSFLFKP